MSDIADGDLNGSKNRSLSRQIIRALGIEKILKRNEKTVTKDPDTSDSSPLPEDVLGMLAAPDWVERREAVRALANYPFEATQAHIKIAMGDADTSVRLSALETAATYGQPEALHIIINALHDTETIIIDAAAGVLKKRGQDVVGPVAELLKHPNVNTRGIAAEILLELAPDSAVSALTAALADEETPWMQDRRICDIAEQALEKIATPEAFRAVDWWRTMNAQNEQESATRTEHGELFVSPIAETEAQSLPATVPPTTITTLEHVKQLLTELQSETWGVREEAAKELQALLKELPPEEDRREIASVLVQHLHSENWVSRLTIAEALAWVRVPTVVPSLKPLVKDDHWMVRSAAIRAMAEYEPVEEIDLLCVALGDSNASVREAAAEAIGRLKNPGVISSLKWVLDDCDPNVRLAVVA
ncbi:MAG: HEAT repeat domain-containing protein, partial [Chloroflexota bacterium]